MWLGTLGRNRLESVTITVATSVGSIALLDLPLACCGLESSAITWEPTSAEPIAAVLCVTGTISTKVAPTVRSSYEGLVAAYPTLPVKVVAVGACASSGGPYWDFPGVTPARDLVPVDLMIPGCPPSPSAIRAGIEQVVS